MATMTVLDSVGASQTVEKPLTPGQAARAASRPVTIATEDITALTATQTVTGTVTVNGVPTTALTRAGGAVDANTLRVTIDNTQVGALGQATMANSAPVTMASNQTAIPTIAGGFEYEVVPISQTDWVLGATGAVGDYLEGLICVVVTAATSRVDIKDGNGGSITVFPANVGAGIGTYYVPLGLKCVNATTPGWKITTQAGVSVIGTGDFT